MDAYTCFAQVYDLFMDNVPYEKWADFLCGQMERYGIRDGILLDLGCGTGKLTRLMADRGYDMIGVDSSAEMLEIAREQELHLGDCAAAGDEDAELRTTDSTGCAGKRDPILYLLQDMREFELYGTVRVVYSVCDSLNYVLSEEDLLTVFRLVNNYLDPEGLFFFDMNTSYKYENLLGENTFAENREESSFIWENYYDTESGINEYDLTLFVKADGMHFCRFQETHYQKNYSLAAVLELLEKAGMEFVAAYDAYTDMPVQKDSERMMIIAREHGKKGE